MVHQSCRGHNRRRVPAAVCFLQLLPPVRFLQCTSSSVLPPVDFFHWASSSYFLQWASSSSLPPVCFLQCTSSFPSFHPGPHKMTLSMVMTGLPHYNQVPSGASTDNTPRCLPIKLTIRIRHSTLTPFPFSLP